MKKIFYFLPVICLTIIAVSCKKDPLDIPLGTIKVDIGGTEYKFNIQAKASRLSVTGGYGVQIQGLYKTTSTTDFTFSIVSPSPVTTGTYTENLTGNPLITMRHCTEIIFPCITRAINNGSVTNPISITIKEITGSSVKGTFKGDLQVSSGGTEVLTNGVFYVSF
jgi:hypothetical protein